MEEIVFTPNEQKWVWMLKHEGSGFAAFNQKTKEKRRLSGVIEVACQEVMALNESL